MSILVALLAACTTPTPEVVSVEPALLMPGDELLLVGAAFDDEVVGELVRGDATVPLPLQVAAPDRALAVVPTELPSGRWSLRVARPSGRHGAAVELEVWRPETEPPCIKRYALAVDTSRAGRRITIERTFADRPPTRDTLVGDQLGHLELAAASGPTGGSCSALWLHDADGRRWLLADDETRDLGPAATALAEALGLDLRR